MRELLARPDVLVHELDFAEPFQQLEHGPDRTSGGERPLPVALEAEDLPVATDFHGADATPRPGLTGCQIAPRASDSRCMNEVRFSDACGITLHRTLRIPDGGGDYPLPPSLGTLPA